MLGLQGPAQPSPMLGDALNAGYRFLEVKCGACGLHSTLNLSTIRRPNETTPIHELERRQPISAQDPPSVWWPGER